MSEKKSIKPLTNYEISILCRELSLLLKAGISPYEGVQILLQGLNNSGKDILESMYEVLSQGEPLSVAMRTSGVFPDYVANMIEIGETSGNLDTVLESIADYYDQEENVQESIKSAVSYPMIMIALMLVVITVLITQVLPIFSQVFSQLGTSMSAFAQTLLNVGNVLNKYSFVLIILLVVICLLFIFFTATSTGKKKFYNFAVKFGPTKAIYEGIATQRFASGMVLMLSSGMDTYESLNMVEKLVENDVMVEKIQKCKNMILEESLSFPEAVNKTAIFNPFYSKMISVGFDSGSIDNVMKQIAERYEQDTQKKIYRFISILEPTLVIILSIIVGVVLLSVILPLLGIMSSIG
ncbi:MAG: type II secretion system F family protein [Butyrivibrio sp.]|nr:type II secretion system F family protein [Butyrivibrio sp.]